MVYGEVQLSGATAERTRSRHCRWCPLTAYRRSELQAMHQKMEFEIEELNRTVHEQAEQPPGARLLTTHPGVGPITALAADVFLGDARRFPDGKALASYVGITQRNTPVELDSG
jgi:transposase